MDIAQVEEILARPTAYKNRKEWYLDKKILKKNKNYKWTIEEKLIIYQLRIKQKKSVAEIQRYFRRLYKLPLLSDIDDPKDKFSRTRIHNQIRIVRRSIEGLCYLCKKPLSLEDKRYIKRTKEKDPLMKLCKKCRKRVSDNKRIKRETLLKDDICPICSRRKVLKGHTACMICISFSHRLRNSEGLCGRCGEKPIADYSISLCEDCLEKQRNKSKKEYKKKTKKVIRA